MPFPPRTGKFRPPPFVFILLVVLLVVLLASWPLIDALLALALFLAVALLAARLAAAARPAAARPLRLPARSRSPPAVPAAAAARSR
jgi:hypothetical protein